MKHRLHDSTTKTTAGITCAWAWGVDGAGGGEGVRDGEANNIQASKTEKLSLGQSHHFPHSGPGRRVRDLRLRSNLSCCLSSRFYYTPPTQ